jgi:hypothetical protein
MTMPITEDHLYGLLPAVYQQRDAAQGYPLRDLMRILASQAALIEADIAAQYDDWFIETCAPWVVPYIGELVGWSPAFQAATLGQDGRRLRRGLAAAQAPRREIANSVGHRRRKGAASLLAHAAQDAAGYPVWTVEFYRRLQRMQHLDHLQPERGRLIDLRDPRFLERTEGPWDDLARSADVRRINSSRGQGRYSPAAVGAFVSRLQTLSVTRTPASQHEDIAPQCYSFSLLGQDTALWLAPGDPAGAPPDGPELGGPGPVTRSLLRGPLGEGRRPPAAGAWDLVYGEGRSLAIYCLNWLGRGPMTLVPSDSIICADLTRWSYRAPRHHVLVDPILGRMVFPANQRPDRVQVSYHFAAPALLGGGEYARPDAPPADARVYRVRASGGQASRADHPFATLQEALDRWRRDSSAPSGPRVGVIELIESGVYPGPVSVRLAPGTTLYLRAANRVRPVVRLVDLQADHPDAMSVRGGAGSRLILDGLIVTGRGLVVHGPVHQEDAPDHAPDVCDVTVRHCTLVPGWSLDCDCRPRHAAEPSIVLDASSARLRVSHSMVGAIQVAADEFRTEPVEITIADGIVDATDREGLAISSTTGGAAFAVLKVVRATVFGAVQVHAVQLAENAIFASPLLVARRQLGCMRYSFAPHGSRTPRRHRCQPDLALQAIDPGLVGAARDAETERVLLRVAPQFESERYGAADYGRLVHGCCEALWRGADDESEMGAYHDLYEPQRLASLRTRLDEYTAADMQSGVIFSN